MSLKLFKLILPSVHLLGCTMFAFINFFTENKNSQQHVMLITEMSHIGLLLCSGLLLSTTRNQL